MSLHLLGPDELGRRKAAARARREYVAFFARMPAGHGGLAREAEEGLAAPALRRELERAATAHGVYIRFVAGLPDEVAFEVEGPIPPRPRRPRQRTPAPPAPPAPPSGTEAQP
jgi:hypothetical protein